MPIERLNELNDVSGMGCIVGTERFDGMLSRSTNVTGNESALSDEDATSIPQDGTARIQQHLRSRSRPTRKGILIYSEDAFLGEGQSGTGLSKALVPMIASLTDAINAIIVNQTHDYHSAHNFRMFGDVPCHATSRLHHVLAKLTEKLPFAMARRLAACHGFLLGLWARIGIRSRALLCNRIWSAVGIDALSLVRLAKFARVANLPFEVYLVDDVEEHPHNARWRVQLRPCLSELLRGASRVYAITPALSETIAHRYSVGCHVLPLTANQRIVVQDRGCIWTYLATYLGSVNHLYADGLKILIAETERLRRTFNLDLRLRIIAPVAQVCEVLGGGLPTWIVAGRADKDEDMHRDLRESLTTFLPYSFDSAARSMTTTSFPSKFLDYLAHARAIVVYAPEWSVPAKCLQTERLPFVANSPEDLSLLLESLIRNPADYSASYRGVLERLHSPEAARSTILGSDASN